MQLDKQVVSLPLAKRLRELGAPQGESYFVWARPFYDKTGKYEVKLMRESSLAPESDPASKYQMPVAAYTVAELGELLLDVIKIDSAESIFTYHLSMIPFYGTYRKWWHISYIDMDDEELIEFTNISMAESCGLMLVWLIEQGYVKWEKGEKCAQQ